MSKIFAFIACFVVFISYIICTLAVWVYPEFTIGSKIFISGILFAAISVLLIAFPIIMDWLD